MAALPKGEVAASGRIVDGILLRSELERQTAGVGVRATVGGVEVKPGGPHGGLESGAVVGGASEQVELGLGQIGEVSQLTTLLEEDLEAGEQRRKIAGERQLLAPAPTTLRRRLRRAA